MKKKLVSILLSILFVLSFSGCTSISDYISNGITNFFSNIFSDVSEPPSQEYGDFHYCYVSKADSRHKTYKEKAVGVNILTLTDEGEQKETIIIPESIDGLPVIAIGMRHNDILGGKTSLKSYQAAYDKIYLPTTVQYICDSRDLYWPPDRDMKPFLINIPNEEFFLKIGGILYIPESDYKKYEPYNYMNTEREEKYPGVRLIIANLTYIVDEDVYWIDDYKEGQVITFPAEPQKEGFLFGGWYKEPELIAEWNEEHDTYSKPENLQTVKLYAKWIEQ